MSAADSRRDHWLERAAACRRSAETWASPEVAAILLGFAATYDALAAEAFPQEEPQPALNGIVKADHAPILPAANRQPPMIDAPFMLAGRPERGARYDVRSKRETVLPV